MTTEGNTKQTKIQIWKTKFQGWPGTDAPVSLKAEARIGMENRRKWLKVYLRSI